MTFWWWVAFVCAWMLVPALMLLESYQRRKFNRWAEEDKQLVDQWKKEQGL